MTASSDSGKNKPTRILLVDDHPVVRDGFAEVINRESDLTVCAAAEDRAGALQAIETTRPGLVVIDLTLKNSSGMELIKDIHSRWPKLHFGRYRRTIMSCKERPDLAPNNSSRQEPGQALAYDGSAASKSTQIMNNQ